MLLFLSGLVASFVVHWPTLGYGFAYDDYGFIHPYTLDQVLASFWGPWDPGGPNVAFFRPLAVTFHAIRFEWLQFDPWAHHVLSLALLGVAVGVLGVTVRRVTDSAGVALLAMCFTAAHPHMAISATAWVTNQMHALQLVVFTVAFWWWWGFCRERSWRWWVPLLVMQLIALLLKEDGVMLAPTIVAAHVLWSWVDHGRPRLPPWPYLILAVLLGAGVIWWRAVALSGLGGYAPPNWERARFNYWRGYSRTLAMLPVDRPGKWVASLFVVMTSVGGALAALRARGRPLFLVVFGWAVVTLCNVPYLFVTKREQWHLLSLGGAILLTGATWALWRGLKPRAARAALAVFAFAAVLAMGRVSRLMSMDFAPFSAYVLETDRIATEWAIVAPEIQAFLHEKRAAWDRTREQLALPTALRTVSYGIHGSEAELRDAGWRWTSRHVTLFVHPHARAVDLPLGAVALPSMPTGPERVSVIVNGRPWRDVVLPVGRWTPLEVPLRSPVSARRLHRVDLWFERAVVPANVDPESRDTRELAARVGEITLVW